MSAPRATEEWETYHGDGYGWMLDQCGDIGMVTHASHLDNTTVDPSCSYCPEEGDA